MLKLIFSELVESEPSVAHCYFLDDTLQPITNVDETLHQQLVHLAKSHHTFDGAIGSHMYLPMPNLDQSLQHILLLGIGSLQRPFTKPSLHEIGAHMFAAIKRNKLTMAAVEEINEEKFAIKGEFFTVNLAYGALLASYSFDRYKTSSSCEPKEIKLYLKNTPEAAFLESRSIAEGIFLARDLVNLAPNDLYPTSYCDIIKEQFSAIDTVELSFLSEENLKELGMGALLGVAQGLKEAAHDCGA